MHSTPDLTKEERERLMKVPPENRREELEKIFQEKRQKKKSAGVGVAG